MEPRGISAAGFIQLHAPLFGLIAWLLVFCVGDFLRWQDLDVSEQFMFDCATAGAAMDRHQSSLLNVEHPGLVDLPLVKATAAQGIALMLL
jgi:hypothetical protein